jgi:hypothetical protein
MCVFCSGPVTSRYVTIENCEDIKEINIHPATNFVIINNCPNLVKINLSGPLQQLKAIKCPNLLSIDNIDQLYSFEGENLSFDSVRPFEQVRELYLTKCHKITEISGIHNLVYFKVDACHRLKSIQISEPQYFVIKNCPRLINVPEWCRKNETIRYNNRWLVISEKRMEKLIKAQAYFRMYLGRKNRPSLHMVDGDSDVSVSENFMDYLKNFGPLKLIETATDLRHRHAGQS